MIEIIGTGYGKQVQIGESYIRQSVINMWDIPESGILVCSEDRFCFYIEELTKTSENGFSIRRFKNSDLTEELEQSIIAKGMTVVSIPAKKNKTPNN